MLRCIDRLGEALVELRQGREERLVVELAILQMTRPETAPDAASLGVRIDRLEERVRLLSEREPMVSPPVPESPVPGTSAPEQSGAVEPETVADIPALTVVPDGSDESAPAPVTSDQGNLVVEGPPASLSLDSVDAAWPAIMARVREEAGMRRHALFREARPAAADGDRLVLEVPAHLPFHFAQLGEDDRLNNIVIAAASEALGGRIRLEYRVGNTDSGSAAVSSVTPERAPDKEQLRDEGEAEIDPAGLVIDQLGGEIVTDD